MSVRFEGASGRSFTDEDVFGADAPGSTQQQLEYTPYYDRTDLNPEEQAMWDDLVREEMTKLESEFQQQALLGATLNETATVEQVGRHEQAMLALAQQQQQQQQQQKGGGSHHFIPDFGLPPRYRLLHPLL